MRVPVVLDSLYSLVERRITHGPLDYLQCRGTRAYRWAVYILPVFDQRRRTRLAEATLIYFPGERDFNADFIKVELLSSAKHVLAMSLWNDDESKAVA